MDEGYLALMIPIISVIGLFYVIIYLRRYQNQERMAMIEKGVDPQLFNLKAPINTSWSLRCALLLIGAGIGLLMGHLLEREFDLDEGIAYFSMFFICGGIGLGASYLIEEKKMKSEK